MSNRWNYSKQNKYRNLTLRVMGFALAILLMAGVFAVPEISIAYGDTATRPTIYARSAVMYCPNTGETLYSKNKNTRVDPFSTTKVLTALIAVQKLKLDDKVTIDAETAAQGENLVEGEVLTVEDLLHYTLMISSNDGAYALGKAVSGDIKSFSKLMNETAEDIGATDSNFFNPNGWLNSKHYTTAADMLKIIKAAFANDAVLKIMETKKYTVAKTNKQKKVVLKNGNRKFTAHDGVYAAKTGFWDFYNCGVVAGYDKDGLKLLLVILGDTQSGRDLDFASLLDYGKAKVNGKVIQKKDTYVGKAKIKLGEKTSVKAYLGENAVAYLPNEASDSLISTKINFDPEAKAPLKAGDKVGTFDIYLAEELSNSVDIIIKEDVPKGWFTSYIGISNKVAVIIGIVLFIIMSLIVAILILRAQNRKKRKLRRQQKIMEMAMAQEKRDMDHTMRDWKF